MVKQRRCTGVVTFIAVCTFAVSGTLPARAIWIELPALSRRVPEGNHLHIYILVISECSNIVAVAFLLISKCSRRLRTSASGRQTSSSFGEAAVVYGVLLIGVASMVVIGLFWQMTFVVDNETTSSSSEHSFVLLFGILLAAIASSVSTVTYIPFVSRMHESHMKTVMFGEAMSSLIPHVLATVQGIGQQMQECLVRDDSERNVSQSLMLPRHQHPQTTPFHTIKEPSLLFNEQIYFLTNACIVAVGFVCFLILHCCTPFISTVASPMSPSQPTATAAAAVDTERSATSRLRYDDVDDCWRRRQSKKSILRQPTTVLDDGTVRQSSILLLRPSKQTDHSSAAAAAVEAQEPLNKKMLASHYGETSTTFQQQQQQRTSLNSSKIPRGTDGVCRGRSGAEIQLLSSKTTAGLMKQKPKLFPLLMMIVLWSSSMINGPLSSVYSYSCYTIDNNIFLVGVVLCDVFVLFSCLLSSRTIEMSVIIAFTCLGTILLSYFVALISFTLQTQAKDFPPFGNIGEILSICIWISVVLLFSFARCRIGIECRSVGNIETVLWFVWIMRLGDVIGSMSILGRISICKIFRVFDRPSCLK